MALLVKEENVTEPIPVGMHQAVCAMVCDIGTHKGEYQGKQTMRHQAVVIWELEEKKTIGQFAGERFQASKFYTLSLDEKSNLRKDLQSWRGQAFTPEELKGFDIERLVGVNCFLNVIHEDGKAKITAITPLAKGMPKIKQTLTKEPEWVGKMRAKSIEATGSSSLAGGPPSSGENPPPPSEDDLPF
jgi:hypothetical protein